MIVKLADSVRQDRLRRLHPGASERRQHRRKDHLQLPNHLRADGDAGAIRHGDRAANGGADTLALLLPGKAVADLRGTTIRINGHGIQVNGPHDVVAEALEAQTDSMHEALDARIDARSDSVDELKDRAAGLEDSAAELSTAARRRVEHSADSVRTVMRAMIDRMKADQVRMRALDHVAGLSHAQLDSLANLAPEISDSVRGNLARELVRMQAELARTLPEAAATPEATPPPAPPKPPKLAPGVRVN